MACSCGKRRGTTSTRYRVVAPAGQTFPDGADSREFDNYQQAAQQNRTLFRGRGRVQPVVQRT